MFAQTLRQNPERLLAVGDIHGCLALLDQLMEQVAPTEQDQVVFLGDYGDRGPDSKGVYEFLLDFGGRFPQTIFLKGNHEQMLLDFFEERDQLTFLLNGGTATLESYREGDRYRFPANHLDFIRDLRLYYETDEFIFVHAGLRPGLPPAKQRESDLLWIRQNFLDSDYDWGKTVVFGHTPMERPYITPTRLGLDTGAVFGRTLTCCEVRTRTFWHESPLTNYPLV